MSVTQLLDTLTHTDIEDETPSQDQDGETETPSPSPVSPDRLPDVTSSVLRLNLIKLLVELTFLSITHLSAYEGKPDALRETPSLSPSLSPETRLASWRPKGTGRRATAAREIENAVSLSNGRNACARAPGDTELQWIDWCKEVTRGPQIETETASPETRIINRWLDFDSVEGLAENAVSGDGHYFDGGVWNERNPTFVWLLGARVFYLLVKIFPAAVRNIWAHSNATRARVQLEKFTGLFVTPRLVQSEIQHAVSGLTDSKLTLRHDKRRRQCGVTYSNESGEIKVELLLTFPECYPLRTVNAECSQITGVPKKRSTNWLLSTIKAINTGSVASALVVWYQNLNLYFTGIEDCPICYSVVHPQHRSLPQKVCPTCKYKFHSECIYRWFKTSHKTNCPLCQSPF